MEWLDIYDEHGNRTGKTAERGTFLSKGEYFLCAHVILENTDGLFLIQQRSDTKATRPGQWDITAGAVDCGEVSLDGALREAKVGVSDYAKLPVSRLAALGTAFEPLVAAVRTAVSGAGGICAYYSHYCNVPYPEICA